MTLLIYVFFLTSKPNRLVFAFSSRQSLGRCFLAANSTLSMGTLNRTMGEGHFKAVHEFSLGTLWWTSEFGADSCPPTTCEAVPTLEIHSQMY